MNKLTPEALAFAGLIDAEEYLRLTEPFVQHRYDVSPARRKRIADAQRRRHARRKAVT